MPIDCEGRHLVPVSTDEEEEYYDVGSWLNESEPEAELCEDTIREILRRLPARTLIRFKLVSKTWLRIITCPNFIRRHFYCYNYVLNKARCKRLFVMHQPPMYTPHVGREISTTTFSIAHDIDRPFQCRIHEERISMPICWDFDRHRLSVHHSALIVSAGLGHYCLFNFDASRVSLWNPATSEIKELPPSPCAGASDVVATQNDRFGFAQVEYNKDDDTLSYKVGVLYSCKYKYNFSYLHLYTSVTNDWKLLKCDTLYAKPAYSDAVNFKGTMHLLSASILIRSPCIITFDWVNERFGRVMEVLPDASYWNRYRIHSSFLTLYDDKYLCLVMLWESIPAHGEYKYFDVWVMREYGVRESWCKVGPTVSYRRELYARSCTMGHVFFMEYVHEAEAEAALSRLWVYNCMSAASEVTQLPITTCDQRPFMRILELMESLVSVCETPWKSMHRWMFQGITTLKLRKCLPVEIQSLPHNFRDLCLLRVLDLSHNNLVELPESLARLRCIAILNVEHNVIEFIPYGIGKCEMLLKIHASHNVIKSLPETIGHLSRLRLLSVAHNKITQLTFSAECMNSLKHLDVSHNLLQYISDGVCSAPSLLTMDISSNHHLSVLPDCIRDIRTLRELCINHTAITNSFRSSLTLPRSFSDTLVPENLNPARDRQDVVPCVQQLVVKKKSKKSKSLTRIFKCGISKMKED